MTPELAHILASGMHGPFSLCPEFNCSICNEVSAAAEEEWAADMAKRGIVLRPATPAEMEENERWYEQEEARALS